MTTDADVDPKGGQHAPATAEQLLKDLAYDAKVVSAYAARAGLLKSSVLPDAIAALNEGTMSWQDSSVVALQTGLNATMLDLAPTNLSDLKGPGAPFQTETMTRYGVAFVIAWALIILVVAWGTLSHNFGLSIRSSLEELKADGAQVRIEQLVRSVVGDTRTFDAVNATAGSMSGVDDASTDEKFTEFTIASAFLASLDEARELDDKTHTAVYNATQFLNDSSLIKMIISPFGTLQTFLNFGANQTSLEQDICSETSQNRVSALYSRPNFGGTEIATAMRYTDVEGLSLTCMRNFKYHLRDYPRLQYYIDQVSLILNVYGLWLLPALYGALGASMYHLRRALNPALPTPPLLRTVNRTIMGSFAGIIIAWFWAPAAQANAEVISIGFNLFVVAFLVGYSIDIFFTFVDRILVTTSATIARLGTTDKAKPPENQGG